MNITVTIQAPELAKAIETLAIALKSGNVVSNIFERKLAEKETAAVLPEAPQTHPEPIQQTAPAAVPTAPIQTPVQQPAHPAAPVTPQAVPTSAPTYTMEQLAVAATQIVDAGRRNELVQLLASFGVQALTGLPKEQYGAFATKLREMGARI